MPRGRFLFPAVLIFIVLLSSCVGAIGSIEVDLGQEFSLALGQSAVIRGENLEITFEEVIGDSRCPSDVQCVWEGRATYLIQIADGSASYKLTLSEPGLSDEGGSETYRDYQIVSHLEPYPISGKEISKGEYRLLLTVSKVP